MNATIRIRIYQNVELKELLLTQQLALNRWVTVNIHTEVWNKVKKRKNISQDPYVPVSSFLNSSKISKQKFRYQLAPVLPFS